MPRRDVGHVRTATPVRSSLRGFSLVEVLIALALISVILLPALSSIATLVTNQARGETRAEALELARSAVEAVKSLDPGSFEAGSTITTVAGPGSDTSYDVERTLTVRDEDDLGNRLWEVTASVYGHPKADGAPALCSMSTFVCGG